MQVKQVMLFIIISILHYFQKLANHLVRFHQVNVGFATSNFLTHIGWTYDR